ncbi:MAG: hypothetical protein ABI467_17585 [Kofleriaceae bacterium]
MATPGYPQMQQPPMMQGGPMGMPPRPSKRGVSRAVPVVVSAGLAVGVFCGLLFGLGTGGETAQAEPAQGNTAHSAGSETPAPPATPVAKPAAQPAAIAASGSAAGSANAAMASNGSGAGSAKPASATGSGAGSAVAVAVAKLTIEVEPPAAAAIAKISVDGKEIPAATPAATPAAGRAAAPPPVSPAVSIDLPAETRTVKVSVTAAGYHSIDKKIDVAAGSETKVQLELVKRSSSGGSPGFGGSSNVPNRVPTAPPKPKKPSNGGIIDI